MRGADCVAPLLIERLTNLNKSMKIVSIQLNVKNLNGQNHEYTQLLEELKNVEVKNAKFFEEYGQLFLVYLREY